MQACSWGFVPLDERGCIPINLITRMDVDPVNAKGVSPGPTHFNIWLLSKLEIIAIALVFILSHYSKLNCVTLTR